GRPLGRDLGEPAGEAMTRVLHGSIAAAVLLSAASAVRGLQEQPAQPPTFPRGVELVRVDVVVTDKSGRPVTGLAQGEFTLLDEGVPQTIETFEAVDLPVPASASGGSAAPRPRVVSNVALPGEPPQPEGRSFVVVFDNMHLTPLHAQRAKGAVAAFLEKGG